LVRAVIEFHGRGRRLAVLYRNQQFGPHRWRVFEEMLEGIYLGPVIEYFGSEGYRQLRLGAHITESRGSEWSAAVGWAQDSQGRASPFVRLNKLKRL
jgi:Cellulose biosynthesis protein BcsS